VIQIEDDTNRCEDKQVKVHCELMSELESNWSSYFLSVEGSVDGMRTLLATIRDAKQFVNAHSTFKCRLEMQ